MINAVYSSSRFFAPSAASSRMRASLSLAVATASPTFRVSASVKLSTAFLKSLAPMAVVPWAMSLAKSASAVASRFFFSSYSFSSRACASRMRLV